MLFFWKIAWKKSKKSNKKKRPLGIEPAAFDIKGRGVTTRIEFYEGILRFQYFTIKCKKRNKNKALKL